jgi:hypothetical protein
LSLEDLFEELDRWCSDNRNALVAGRPDRTTLEAILGLFIAPERISQFNMEKTINVLITDRGISRTVRYMYLRSRDTQLVSKL